MFSIECSLGELLDKYSILNLKLNNVFDFKQEKNIKKELSFYSKYNLEKTYSEEYKKIFVVNSLLWNLEDEIKEKIQNQEFDTDYIEISKKIFQYNKKRHSIKSEINNTYNSVLKEEKIYSVDVAQLIEKAQIFFNQKDLLESKKILQPLLKYKKIDQHRLNIVVSAYILNENIIEDSLFEKTVRNAKKYTNNVEQIQHAELMLAMHFLKNKRYTEAYEFYNRFNVTTVKHLNIYPENMSGLKPQDSNKKQLIYSSGGLGDIIMFSRFIEMFCNKNINNEVFYIVHDSLYWMMQKTLSHISNLKIIPFEKRNSLQAFDYHFNICTIIKFLNLRYEDIYSNYYLQSLSGMKVDNVLSTTKKNIIVQWKSYYESKSINLKFLISLFISKQVNWISIQKNLTTEENEILKKYGVQNCGEKIDKGGAFENTIYLIKNSNLTITCDTSIAHVAGTLNAKTCLLLPHDAEWRWTKDKSSNWYPDMQLFRGEFSYKNKCEDYTKCIDDIRVLI